MRRLALALLFVGAAACGNDFDPQEWIKTPRLVGVIADPPEVARAQTSQLTALVADPTGGAQPTFTWYRCTKVAAASFAGDTNPDCLTDDIANAPWLEPIAETSPGVATVTMPDVAQDQLGLPDYTIGLYAPFRVDMKIGDTVQKTIYRLRYLLPTPIPPNQNPSIEGVYIVPPEVDASLADTKPLPMTEPYASVAVDEQLKLRVKFTDGSAESFLIIDGDPKNMNVKSATEQLRVSWLATWGRFSHDHTGDQRDTDFNFDKEKRLPSTIPPEGTLVQVWMVGRDERGGTTWMTTKVRLFPKGTPLDGGTP